MTQQPPKLNHGGIIGINQPAWRVLHKAKPFLLHPDGTKQPATAEEVHTYVQTGKLP